MDEVLLAEERMRVAEKDMRERDTLVAIGGRVGAHYLCSDHYHH